MLLPLARLFKVSADELLGFGNTTEVQRQEELKEKWGQTWESGDTAARYEIAKTAVEEFPGNFEYLIWLADAEDAYGGHNCADHSAEQKSYWEKAVRHYEMIIEDCRDTEIRNDAIYGIVMTLSCLGRRDEAFAYAKQHPRPTELYEWCLTGEALEMNRQELVFSKMLDLIYQLERKRGDLSSLQAAETVVKTVVDDGNYLGLHDTLMHNLVYQARCLTKLGRYQDAVEKLKAAYSHAVSYEKIWIKAGVSPLPYTGSILNRISFDPENISNIGNTTKTQDIHKYLLESDFDALRKNDDFITLYQTVQADETANG